MATSEELRAALAVAELEEQLLEAKADGADAPAELKLALREARRVHRSMREGIPLGDGEARPDAIEAGTTVNGVN